MRCNISLVFNPTTGKFDVDNKQSLTTLDSRYVNVTGGTMTGGLLIEPTVDTLTALVVNDTDSNNVLTVDTINNRVGVDELRALSASGLKLYEDGGKGIFVEDSSGNVGIGTTTPGQKLHVAGNSYLNGTVDINNNLLDNVVSIRGMSTDWTSIAFSIYDLVFSTRTNIGAAAERLKIEGGAVIDDILISNSNLNVNSGQLYVQQTTGNVGIGTTGPTAKLDINSNILRLRTAKTPASAGAAGNVGDICWDANFIYVAVATNTWKKASIATW